MRRTHDRSDSALQYPSVAVIGAGAGGVAMGVRLRMLGVERFTIFEQSDGLGGTWRDNTYPGAEVDTPVPFYSFNFHPYDFERNYIPQKELLRYLENVAEKYSLTPNFSFNNGVRSVRWREDSHDYELETMSGERHVFDVVVSAVGILNHPNMPTWPGLDEFEGPMMHSARWDDSVELRGKRVAVVGTGSSSAQIVPSIAPIVDHLYVFQRQPGWVSPKGSRAFTPAERARLLHPVWRRLARLKQRLAYERVAARYTAGSRANKKASEGTLRYINTLFADRPDLKAAVTPNYPFGGKRTVKDDNFFPALLRENVELVPRAVSHVTRNGIVDADGVEREIDVLIACTGFQPANFLATYEVTGRDGRTIHDVWNGDAEAYLGLSVSGFPNFYMLYGPNTNGAPIMYMHERQTEFVAAHVRRMAKRKISSIEVRPSVLKRFNSILQRRLSKYVVNTHREVNNYGRSASGRNVIGWSEGMAIYSLLTHTTRGRMFFQMRKRSDRLASQGQRAADDVIARNVKHSTAEAVTRQSAAASQTEPQREHTVAEHAAAVNEGAR